MSKDFSSFVYSMIVTDFFIMDSISYKLEK
jgi:hypothetical protein